MTNHAVLTVWTLDNHNFDPVERDKLLTEDVVPRVSTLPGFVEGRWNRSSDGARVAEADGRRPSGHRRLDQFAHLRRLQPGLLGRLVVGLGLRQPFGVDS